MLGGIGLVFAFAGAIYAFQTTTVANALLFFAASPFVAAVLGRIVLREAVRPATWVAIGIAVFGILIMVRDGLDTGAFVGNMAALLSAAGFGTFSVVLRWGRVGDMLPAVLLGGVFSAIVAAVVLVVQGAVIVVSVHDMGVALAIGAFVVALGLVLFTLGSRVVPAAELTLLSLIEVLLGPIWVWLFLGETASGNTLIGGTVLLAAVLLNGLAGAARKSAEGVADRSVP